MPSKAQKNRGYLLPDEITGHDLIMVCLCIPDTLAYRAAFRNAVYELTKTWNWEMSYVEGDTRARDAAYYWLEILAEYFKMPCNICELMAACIENMQPGDALYDALKQWLANSLINDPDIAGIIGAGGNGSTPSPIGSDIMIDECDPDLLFGFTLQLVQFMNTAIVDFFEIVEVYTNFDEFLAAVTSEASYIGVVLDYAAALQETFIENYQAAYTIGYENSAAHDLFCFALDHDCKLTWQQVADYFLHRLFTGLADNDIWDLLSVLASGVWTGEEFCDLMMASLASVLYYAGEWLGLSLADWQTIWQTWLNDPNPDWALLGQCNYNVLYEWAVNDPKGWTVVTGRWLEPENPAGNPNLYSLPLPAASQIVTVQRSFSPTFDGLQEVRGLRTGITGFDVCQPAIGVEVVHSGGTYTETKTDMGCSHDGNMDFQLGGATLNGVSYVKYFVREDIAQDEGGSCRLGGIYLKGVGDNTPPHPE